jgi:hypothetical protein
MPRQLTGLVVRRLEAVVRDLLTIEPVVALHGPRTVGKSTLLDRIATTVERRPIDLDDPATRRLAAEDPAFVVGGPPPVCIDEYQHEPALLDAIKAQLNRDLSPGRFVLTGSTSYASIPLTAQSLTGRLHRRDVWPLSQGEIGGVHETFTEHALADPLSLADSTPGRTTRADYAERATTGGMPLALARPDTASRWRWFDDYVQLVLDRDVVELSRVRQRAVLPRLLADLAATTGQQLVVAAVADRTGVERSTAENYLRLLEAAFLVHRLPAWGSTLRKRINVGPKIHLVDTGVGARLLRLTPEQVMRREPAAMTEFGHLVETFVVNEVLKQASWLVEPITTGHFRTREGAEVDLVLERGDGGVVGLEVKASAGPLRDQDLAGLRTLRDLVGDRFVGGIVVHLGEVAHRTRDGFAVVPADRLWQGDPVAPAD